MRTTSHVDNFYRKVISVLLRFSLTTGLFAKNIGTRKANRYSLFSVGETGLNSDVVDSLVRPGVA